MSCHFFQKYEVEQNITVHQIRGGRFHESFSGFFSDQTIKGLGPPNSQNFCQLLPGPRCGSVAARSGQCPGSPPAEESVSPGGVVTACQGSEGAAQEPQMLHPPNSLRSDRVGDTGLGSPPPSSSPPQLPKIPLT